MVLSVVDGGKGLIAAHQRRLGGAGIETWYDSRVTELILEGGAVSGVSLERDGQTMNIRSSSVILACGGFEADPDYEQNTLEMNGAERG